ncbi:ABC1 kinase family protein [Mucispirillum schaedleri]|jgi:ubiquinone biosynthesis protein|uniref:Protein kinase UbiB n=1 Tax=Mucispirillum schaedleri ASF457 TaxID=1379858 RepID=V2PX85_9BACT|nr:AarF/UbiB family protein [Mucispirillum schaedleri]MCX4361577.1 AarF/UbiB family protein [Mucispirillum schaedleri]USF24903.1 protein kinase UbiB [Mucispirillum schaedleri ASF457]SIW07589.1 conserved hypothetical protein [Mucispirillum schaedleri ASF457]
MKSKYNERTRLREILSIIRKHNIITGITPEKLRSILEDLGPTYIKMGQIMSMQTDALPQAFLKELEKLRTDVPPMSDEDLCFIIQETYNKDISELFDDFSYKSLGSASIAQVHSAKLKKSGTQVVLKIQRRDIYKRMEQDIKLMRRVANMVQKVKKDTIIDFETIIDELWKTAQEEMNFLKEAENAVTFYNNHKNVIYATCPEVYTELSSEKILVMEYVDGFFIDNEEMMKAGGYDKKEIAAKLAEDYISQVIDYGFFHADPHPGNIKIRDGQIIWIDLGMMGKLSPRDKGLIADLIASVAKHDTGRIKDIALTLGNPVKDVDHVRLYSDIDLFLSKYSTMDLGNMSLAGIVSELLEILHTHHIQVPSTISMLARGIMTLEGVLAFLNPDINVIDITAAHIKNSKNPASEFTKKVRKAVMELSGSLEKLALIPGFTIDILQMIAKGQVKINSELQISENAQSFIERMIQRIILALITAAIIIGSSLIAIADIQPVIFNLPLFTTIGYIAAGLLTISLFKGKYK